MSKASGLDFKEKQGLRHFTGNGLYVGNENFILIY